MRSAKFTHNNRRFG